MCLMSIGVDNDFACLISIHWVSGALKELLTLVIYLLVLILLLDTDYATLLCPHSKNEDPTKLWAARGLAVNSSINSCCLHVLGVQRCLQITYISLLPIFVSSSGGYTS